MPDGTTRIAVFIAARNEEDRVGKTVEAAWRIEGVSSVVVIDDASTDSTAVQALAAGATVVRLSEHAGKGGALMAGISDTVFDYCLFLDADLGDTAEQGVLLLAPVVAGELDMSIARFPSPARRAGMGKVKGLAAAAIAKACAEAEDDFGAGFAGDGRCMSPLSGQRAFTAECLRALMPLADGFGVEVALTVGALRKGFRVGEVETCMSHRATGNDVRGYAHRLLQYADVKKAVARLDL